MSKKLTWNKIYKRFKEQHPHFAKKASCWRPYDFATILVYLKDNRKITYNIDTNEVKPIEE